MIRLPFARAFGACSAVATALGLIALAPATASAATTTTAWHNGQFAVDTPDVVRAANIVLGRPNTAANQSMPLGNGTLGAAVWAANGLTAQLNRSDTLPNRRSPGWVQIPGLSAITTASDFSAVVDPYDGVLRESGGGMAATVYVRADSDVLVVDVTGADPNSSQTATVNLWSGRSPAAAASGAMATLAETWVDNTPTTGSGQTFGSLAALTAGGRGVTASVVGPETIKVSFTPHANGSFRVVVGAPHWAGGNASSTAKALLGSDATASSASLESAHLAWWHDYWAHLGLIRLSSSDGTANYLQNVRTLYYFMAAEQDRDRLPGSQAGVADLFNFSQDNQDWYPAGYWFWNLRGQVAANIGAGAFALNAPVYTLYTSNLANIQAWTKANMGGRPGICVPETMRFNGNGYQNDSDPVSDASCDQNIAPTWNGETISTGAEIGLWVWQQYLTTGDQGFLAANYPLMSQECQFLLAYATPGSDGLLHEVANVHENQWDVQDPVNVIDAMRALFPATIQAARILGTDADLASRLQTVEGEIPDYPRTDASTHSQLLTAADDASGADVLGQSSQPTADVHNSENDDLEAVWPYGLIGDQGPLTALAQRTFTNRLNTGNPDWSFDAVQAARLGLADQVGSSLVALTKEYQAYPDGLGSWQGGTGDEPYIEQAANVALAVNEALAQDYDGVLRIAPALRSGWDADGTQYIRGGSTVSVQVHNGVIGTVGVTAGSTGTLTVRNPWPGRHVEVVDGTDESTVEVAPTTSDQFDMQTTAGSSYLIQPVDVPVSAMSFAAVTGTPATSASHLGPVQIGLDPAATDAITGVDGLCADVDGGSSANGTAVQVWGCNGGSNQQWHLPAPAAQASAATASKKGVGLPSASGYGGTQLAELNAHWFYDWSATSSVRTNAEFVPMIFAPKDAGAPVSAAEVLGFNEPDNANQANVTVSQALATWSRVAAKAPVVGSPAVAGNPVTGKWLPSFMAANPKADFITMHWYKGVDATKFEQDVTALANAYHKPVWVTEFAPQTKAESAASPTKYAQQQVDKFIAAVVAWMDSNPSVARYAWHDSGAGTSALYNSTGGLSATGQAYAAAH